MEFAYDGGGLARAATVTLFVDGEKVRQRPVDATLAMVFSADDGATSAWITARRFRRIMAAGNAFNGTVKGVQLAINADAEVIRSPCNTGAGASGCDGASIVASTLSGWRLSPPRTLSAGSDRPGTSGVVGAIDLVNLMGGIVADVDRLHLLACDDRPHA